MNSLVRLVVIIIAFGFYIGCSNVKFSRDESSCAKYGISFIIENDNCVFTETITAGGGKVDILIVNDNSASMSFEQKNLAARFNNFIQRLEDRFVDYRIAITTTDISSATASGIGSNSPRAINGNGALQDGKLITFANGSKYLTSLKKPSSASDINTQVALFSQAIQRPETLTCENFIANWIATGHNINETAYASQYYENCPTGDERGVFAANLVLERNPDGFIRPGAHLAIIFLADENVRSNLMTSQSLQGTKDSSGTLIQNFNSLFGQTKSLMAHAIVAKDNACVSAQSNQALGNPAVPSTAGLVKGSLGSEYLAAATATGGVQGDICANDYTTQLGDINTRLEEQISEIRLACSNPQNLNVNILGNNVLTYSVNGNILQLSNTLPLGTTIQLRYSCSGI